MDDLTTRLLLTVPSRLDEIDLVQEVVEAVARVAGIGDDGRMDIGLAVREGTINAMKHGNGLDSDIPVEVVVAVREDALEICVRDHGRGFDPGDVPDPTLPENLLRPSGRGLFLIRSLVDEVSLVRRKKGMELVMVKRRPPLRLVAEG